MAKPPIPRSAPKPSSWCRSASIARPTTGSSSAATVDRGPATVVTLLWETPPGYVAQDIDYHVRARIEAVPTLWLAPPDHFEKEMAPPEALRPALWKPGRLYVQRFVAMKRVGRERFEGVFTSREGPAPRGVDGALRHTLFTLD